MSCRRRYVYGPVPSRRLGRSLGVDLVPFKTCSYDCVYCQLGPTTHKTIELKEYAPLDEVIDELDSKLLLEPTPDFIGIAGSGEPTLHARLGDLIAAIKRMTSIPVAVLTNGSLLWMPEVRASLAQADFVIPSLDVSSQQMLERVNRPHRGITFDRMVEGLILFAESFPRAIWLEVFVLAGINDDLAHMQQVANLAKRLHPARIQLNTVSRPPAQDCAIAASRDALERLLRLFPDTCEIIAERCEAETLQSTLSGDAESEILALLARRPCTVEQIAEGLGLGPNLVIKCLDGLFTRGALHPSRRGDAIFYEKR